MPQDTETRCFRDIEAENARLREAINELTEIAPLAFEEGRLTGPSHRESHVLFRVSQAGMRLQKVKAKLKLEN